MRTLEILALLGPLAVALPPHTTHAAPVRLVEVSYTLEAGASSAPEGRRPQSLTATARVEAGSGSQVPQPVSASSTQLTLTLGLSAGAWRLTTNAAGFWAPPVEVQVPDGVGPPVAISVKLWRAVTVGGGLRVPGQPHATLEATIQSPPGTPVASSVPSTSIACSVSVEPEPQASRWQCVFPATTLDVRLAIQGLVPLYLWDLPLGSDPGATQDLAFQQGSSVAGFIVDATGAAVGQRCRVKLAAPDGTEVLGHDSSGRPKVSFLATANERGFFQIVGAPPGSYLVVAEEPARGRAETTATVSARNETWINQAIQLEPAASVTFDLTPPLSPAGTPWSLQLLYARNGQQVSHAYPKHKVTEAGRLQVPRLLRARTASSSWAAATRPIESKPYGAARSSTSTRGTVRSSSTSTSRVWICAERSCWGMTASGLALRPTR